MKRNTREIEVNRHERLSLKVSLIYALLGVSWILFSDKLNELITSNPQSLAHIFMVEGCAFILLTAVLLYLFIHREMLRLLDTEAALRKSLAEYRELVENADSIILRMDPDGNLTFVNEYGLRFFGYREEELIGRNVVGTIVRESEPMTARDPRVKIERICLEPDRHAKRVCENVLCGGERVWIAWTNRPIRKNGRIEEILSVGIDITDRKQARDALERANTLLRARAEASINGILTIDENEVIISSNRRFSAMWGLSEELASEGLNSRSVMEAIAEKTRNFEELYRRMLSGDADGGKTSPEIDLKDGRIFEYYSAPMTGTDGKFYGRSWYFRDITERKTMERTAAEAEAKYRDIFENSVTGIYQVTLDGRFLNLNTTIANILGYGSSAELLEDTGYDGKKIYVDPGKRSELLRIIEQQGVAREFCVEFLRKDKSVVWVSLDVRAVRDKSGEIKYLEGTCRDISRQKQMEQAAFRAEEKYRHIFENSVIGIFQVSREGGFLGLNSALARTLGYVSPEALMSEIGMVRQLFVHPERHAEILELTKKHGAIEQFEAEVFRKDRSIMWVSLNLNVVRDSDGRAAYLNGAVQDITDSKLLRVQLDKAQRMEAIGTLAGGIAHDFNNILTPIIGYTELSLISTNQDTRLANNMRQILLSANRAKDLVKQILTFSRDTEHELKPVQVSLIIKEVLNLLRSSLPTTIEIHQAIEKDSIYSTTMAEPTQIHQVLMNLCTNAAHAMRAKGGTLTVSLAKKEVGRNVQREVSDLEAGVYLQLTVTDTGHGMDESVRERIFDPYFTTKGPDEGTGLGLAVVYGIVKNLSGTITVSSKPGQGAAFDVYLPAMKTIPASPSFASAPLQQGSGLVLVVDDEKPIVDMTGEMLQTLGYNVVMKQNGADALDAFRANPKSFDAVITDMTMPKMTGADLAREILAVRSDVPIILCTGFSENFDEEKAKTLGIKAFLMKPVAIRDLALVLGKIVAPRQ